MRKGLRVCVGGQCACWWQPMGEGVEGRGGVRVRVVESGEWFKGGLEVGARGLVKSASQRVQSQRMGSPVAPVAPVAHLLLRVPIVAGHAEGLHEVLHRPQGGLAPCGFAPLGHNGTRDRDAAWQVRGGKGCKTALVHSLLMVWVDLSPPPTTSHIVRYHIHTDSIHTSSRDQ